MCLTGGTRSGWSSGSEQGTSRRWGGRDQILGINPSSNKVGRLQNLIFKYCIGNKLEGQR